MQTATVALSVAEALFEPVEPGTRYVLPITVHNLSLKGQRIRFVPPRSNAFRLAVQNDIELAPGLELQAELSFLSDEVKDFDDKFIVLVGRSEHSSEQLTVPVRARQHAAHLVFEPVLDFGAVVLGHSESRTLTVTNTGSRDGMVTMVPQAGGQRFQITPLEARVPAGSATSFKVQLIAKVVETLTAKAEVHAIGGTINDQPNSTSLQLRAQCVTHLIELRDVTGTALGELLELGQLYFGLQSSVPLVIFNNGPAPINWTSSMKARADDVAEAEDEVQDNGAVRPHSGLHFTWLCLCNPWFFDARSRLLRPSCNLDHV